MMLVVSAAPPTFAKWASPRFAHRLVNLDGCTRTSAA
jgi:hypothetical protein